MKNQILSTLSSAAKISLKNSRDVFNQNHFSVLLNEEIKEHIGLQRRLALKFGFSKYDKSLSLTKKSSFSESEFTFREGVKFKNSFQEPIDRALLDVFELPAVSYWHYKKNEYQQAELLLWQAIENDFFLEKNGFPILSGHRIQQLHNIARIYFKVGDFDKGCKVIQSALTFLVKGVIPNFSGKWSYEDIENGMPNNLKSVMFWQLASETLSFIHKYKSQDFSIYFKKAFDGLDDFIPNSEDEEWHIDFFRLKQHCLKQDYSLFLDGVLPFIRKVDVNYALHACSVLMDVLDLSDCMGVDIDQDTYHLMNQSTIFSSIMKFKASHNEIST